jgi:hypothetical protein
VFIEPLPGNALTRHNIKYIGQWIILKIIEAYQINHYNKSVENQMIAGVSKEEQKRSITGCQQMFVSLI